MNANIAAGTLWITTCMDTFDGKGGIMASKDRGFASMDPEKQKEIASKGGKASPKNFKNRPEQELKEIARKGGKASHRSKKR